jgi:hypothetical protein
MILHRRRHAITEASDPLQMTREAGPARVWLFQALLLDAMTTYIGRSGLTAALRVKLIEVLYVPWICQWLSILHSQANTSRVANLGYLKGALPVGGEHVGTLLSEHPPEH